MEIVNLSLLIERSKPSLETAKDMAMYIRRLGFSYGTAPQNSWIARFVPTYLFGKSFVKHFVLNQISRIRKPSLWQGLVNHLRSH